MLTGGYKWQRECSKLEIMGTENTNSRYLLNWNLIDEICVV